MKSFDYKYKCSYLTTQIFFQEFQIIVITCGWLLVNFYQLMVLIARVVVF